MRKIIDTSMNLVKHDTNKLRKIFPNVFVGDKIDFYKLRELLGDELDDNNERFNLSWKGKLKSIKIAQTPSKATLRLCSLEKNERGETKNLYIEGDNLEVLKLLQKTYFGKIDVIYIDPPYNTGGDFVYKDDFKDSIKSYKEQTNQTSRSNADTNGRFHTDWLNMMYPRLMLARNLLSDKGVIFISIDDHENHNLKTICNEVFGEFNYIATIIWERAFSPVNTKKHFSPNHDYVFCYAKNSDYATNNGLVRDAKATDRYTNLDNDSRGPWTSGDLSVGPAVESNIYEIITPSGRKVLPPSGYSWRLNKERYNQFVSENRIWFGEKGDNVPRIKRFLSDVKTGITPMTVWRHNDVGHSQSAQQSLKQIFNGKAMFDYPKSLELIKRIISLYSNNNSLILDFFSGSATTAHAVMKLNAEDGGNRKFIMVQLPEKTDEKSEAYKAGFKNICEIGKERIRRAGEQIKHEMEKEGKDSSNLDVGFKVFKLDDTNIKEWDSSQEVTESTLFDQQEVFKEGRTTEDVLYEILLKYGVLDMPVSETLINDKVAYDIGHGDMIVALFDDITSEDVKAIAEKKPRVVIFKDSGFENDNVKLNALHNLEKQGVQDVKTI